MPVREGFSSFVLCHSSQKIADWHQPALRGPGWRPSDFRPYLDTIFDAFGTQRIMFGSDWPVCTLAGTYANVVEIISDYTQQLSEEEQADVWGETARKFYGLDKRLKAIECGTSRSQSRSG